MSPDPSPCEGSRSDAVTFEDLFVAERQRLYSAMWLIVRDSHEAEDIAQEAFVKVWERWERQGPPNDPVAYVFVTAMNVMRNRRRRAAVALRKLVTRPEAPDELAAIEVRDVVVRALGTLTSSQRAALVLVDLLDLTSQEAAKALGTRPSTVRVLAARGRASLSTQIGESND